MITFAYFHMDVGRADLHAFPQPWRGLVSRKPEERNVYLDISICSCRAKHEDCRTVVITNEATCFAEGQADNLFRCAGLDSTRLMFSHSLAWIVFLETIDTHVVLLDTDILIQENLEDVFRTEFDAGLTYRAEEEWPINAGIQFFHRARLERSRAFLRACLDIFETYNAQSAAWGGDQDALKAMTAGAAFDRDDAYLWHSPGGFDLLMLPCNRYNFSTPQPPMPGPYPGVPVLHFKGKRKDNMPATGTWVCCREVRR